MSATVRRRAAIAIRASSAARILMGVDSVFRESVAREERDLSGGSLICGAGTDWPIYKSAANFLRLLKTSMKTKALSDSNSEVKNASEISRRFCTMKRKDD